MQSKTLLFSIVLSLVNVVAFAQDITVRGTITDASNGDPIIGATITTSEVSVGTITDFDGNYEINVPTDATLNFSYTGMKTISIPVNGQSIIDLQMETNASLLEEVVVVGYGTQKRSKITGAVSVVTSEEITEMPVLRVEQALQGRTAGVQVAQNSGAPGAALTVRVRGVGTINGADPLYIVDGVQVSGLDFLNPSDIESINVLKDAASAAIYGTRGANGVVLITTKTGKKGQPGKVSYEGYYGMQNVARTLDLLNAREYAIIQNEARIASGLVPLPELAYPDALGEGTDWQDALFESAPITNHQLSFTGASDKSTYALSGNYFTQDGIIGGDKASFERYTARLNTDHQLKDWLSVGNTLSLTHFTRDAIQENNEFVSPVIRALNIDPVTPVYKRDGTYAYSRYSDTDITNPLNAIEQTFNTWTSNRLVGSFYGKLNILPNLFIKSTYSVDATFAKEDKFNPRFDLSNNPILSDAPAQEKSLVNSVSFGNFSWVNQQVETIISYEKQIGTDHSFSWIGGNTIQQNRHEFNGGSNTNLPSNDPDNAYIDNTIDPIASQGASQGAEESALLSFFSRVNYGFADKYLLTATVRMDGSSKFGRNNRFGYFPSVSAGWLVTQEDFWNIDEVSFLKFRASWGQNGNDNIGAYRFTSVVRSGQNYVFGTNEDITSGSVALEGANADLQWETSTQTNIGADLELYQGKWSFTTDYFIKETADMLFAAPIPFTVGAAPPIQNIATMENRGWEFSLQNRDKIGAFSYSLSGNIAFIQTEITSLGAGSEPFQSGYVQSANANVGRTDVGQSVGAFYGYVTDGLFQNRGEIEAAAFQSENTAPGDIRFKDLNGDGVIDLNDQTYIGDPTPDFTYGINGDIAFKGVDLSFFLQGVQGNDVYNGTVRYDFNFVNRPASVLGRWTGEGTSTTEPRVTVTDPNQNVRVSDRFVEDGSYLKLKNVQLGYTLPNDLLAKLKCSKFRVYVSAQNLLTFTNYSGLDPEIGTIGFDPAQGVDGGVLEIGIDRGFYPQARTFLGGIQIGF